MSLPTSVYQSIERAWANETLDAMKQFIRLPSKSRNFDKDWEAHGYLLQALKDAADFGKKYIPNGTFEIIQTPGKTPALFVDIPAFKNHKGKPAFYYGHFDKQPETLDGWYEGFGPWIPVVKDNRLYGRGSVDDGYSFYLMITMVKALEENGIAHPVIKGIFETDEESGSRDLPYYIETLAPRIGEPAFLTIIDLDCADWSRPYLTQSLRGVCVMTVTVKVLDVPAHSGAASAIVPSSFRIMRQLLDRIEDPTTGEILLPELHTQIPEEYIRSIAEQAEEFDVRKKFSWAGNTNAGKTAAQAMLDNTWKPSLAIIGADGLPDIGSASNLIRTSTSLVLSFRIPPGVNGRTALDAVKRVLTTDVPYGAQVTISNTAGEGGFVAEPLSGWLAEEMDNAGLRHFGNKTGYIFCGASIGTLPCFQRAFPTSPFVNTGALGPGANAHAPNEFLDLKYTVKLSCVLADILASIPDKE